jgi:hypothetical protein
VYNNPRRLEISAGRWGPPSRGSAVTNAHDDNVLVTAAYEMVSGVLFLLMAGSVHGER